MAGKHSLGQYLYGSFKFTIFALAVTLFCIQFFQYTKHITATELNNTYEYVYNMSYLPQGHETKGTKKDNEETYSSCLVCDTVLVVL